MDEKRAFSNSSIQIRENQKETILFEKPSTSPPQSCHRRELSRLHTPKRQLIHSIRMHDRISSPRTQIRHEDFGPIADGRRAAVYTLENAEGLRIRVSDFGATLVSCEAPDKNGNLADITLGYDSAAGYEGPTNPYFGATVGRYANRIGKGRFKLDGKDYTLATNNDPAGIPCHLHGGLKGFAHVLWAAEPAPDGQSIAFRYLSKDGEEGYPGNLDIRVTYTLSDDNELTWEATATTDAPTVLNLINHSYWNVSGDPSVPITRHELTLFADSYLPTDPGMIPTGEIAPVKGTPMDFTRPHIIGDRIDDDFEDLKFGAGYDHCWVLAGHDEQGIALAARLRDPESGRIIEFSTNQPGVQFYAANWVHENHFSGENLPGKNGHIYGHRSACCLETENFPDAPNKHNFPSAVLRPGETYRHILIHRFSAE
jgi:aldose 1-epimerase